MYSRPKIIIFISAILGIVFAAYQIFLAPPGGFKSDSVINVPKGETLSGAADTLSQSSDIKSRFLFKAFMVVFGGTHGLVAGDYYFAHPENVVKIAWRFTHGSYKLQDIKVTIPEGFSSKDIAALFAKDKRFTHFKSADFLKLAAPFEGYLFPDTYLFLPAVTAQDVFDAMRSNYERRILSLSAEIKASGRTSKDVIKMASIIEEEARTTETREIIAGILWKRLDQGMPLQVDAAFAFVNGKKDSKDLTLDDLKIASPYNTYINKGLPPTPISNPGLDAIRDTVHPIKTKYYFYLSDKNGDMHYAATLEEHVENKLKYLDY